MRIIVNGQQAFGKAVLDALLERGEHVVGVYCGPDREGRPADPLKETAVEHGIPVFQPTSFRRPEVSEEMRGLEPDLCVMAYVTLFVPQQVLDVPTHGSIQYHPSLLPLHRGPSSINWPIIQGSKKTGLSIFWPDDGLDEGPILLQKEVEIRDDDTLGSVYFERLFPMGVEAMLEAVDLVRDGKAPRIPQDHSRATYEGWCRHEDARIAWARPVEEVYNFIRGTNPQPGAWTTHAGKVLKIYDCARLPAAGDAEPGTVTAAQAEGITVAVGGGGRILVKRVRPEGGGKVSPAEAGIEPGARLGE